MNEIAQCEREKCEKSIMKENVNLEQNKQLRDEIALLQDENRKLLNAVESEKEKTTAEEARKLEALETVKGIEKKVEKIEKEKQELIQEQVDKKLEVSTMEKEICVLEETNNDILNIVETERNKYDSLNIQNEHLVTSLEKEKKNNNLLFVKERESIEKLNALQEDVAQKERVNKDLLEEIFDKCLENNRLLDEMTVLEKKMDEMQKIVQQEREEHMNLSVKEREASEKIKELQNDAIKLEGLTKDLSGDLYNKCVENTKLQEEVNMLKEKNDELAEVVHHEKDKHETYCQKEQKFREAGDARISELEASIKVLSKENESISIDSGNFNTAVND